MKKYIHLTLAILVTFPLNAKVEILDRVAIIVGDGVVLESQINSMLKSIEQRFAEQGAALPPAESMLEQVRERLIIEELQLQMAIRGGVRVGDGELNQAFEEIAKNNEMTLEAFIESLESEGASYEELRDQVRKEMIIQRVQRGKVGRQVDITEQELDGFLATEGSVKELSPELFIRQILVEDKIKAEKVLSDLESGEDFQVLAKERSTNANAASGGEMGWRNLADLPSLFADALKGKKKGYVSPPLESGSGFFVLQLEDKRGNLVRFEEQWNARHILMMPTKLRDETFTQSELEAVRDRAMAGEDFALLAKEFSEDPGSASRGGDLEWLSLGKTAPAFEKMMTTSPLQEISPVFESEFGFHFLQVLGQRTEDLTEEVIKDRAYGIIFARKYDEELENSLRTMRAEAFVEFKELD
ncbi:peptidylprolyl isomerase [Gammaproteobacteria bacterium]|nr:peptidylprolyl isomerase [Gammaproteobacteria bacterium]MDC3380612.1 peptidylprolyl isomerase [Gammaproteobacteria bacterium]